MAVSDSCSSSSGGSTINTEMEIVEGLLSWRSAAEKSQETYLARHEAIGRILRAYDQKERTVNLSDLKIGRDLPKVLEHLSGLLFLVLNRDVDIETLPCLPDGCQILTEERENESGMSQEAVAQQKEEDPNDKCRRWLKQSEEMNLSN